MLLDTSGLLCLHQKTEPFNSQACQFYRQATLKITHNYILAEYVALANARRFNRLKTLTFMSDLLNNPDIEIIWIDQQLHQEALELLLARQDKDYSHCDAVSFVIMRRKSIIEALTTDHHFEQEGFQRLLS